MMTQGYDDILREALIWLIPCLFAITLHECAHGWMALRFGDTTARDMGRLSLNPLRHIDVIGTIIVPSIMLLAHLPFVFGWAKPVPVNFERLSHKRMGTIFVALAGPLANLAMMIGWLFLGSLIAAGTTDTAPSAIAVFFVQMALSGITINFVFMLLNLIPIPPLDGGRIVGALLPTVLSKPYMRLERYGILILFLLIAVGAFNFIVRALVDLLPIH